MIDRARSLGAQGASIAVVEHPDKKRKTMWPRTTHGVVVRALGHVSARWAFGLRDLQLLRSPQNICSIQAKVASEAFQVSG